MVRLCSYNESYFNPRSREGSDWSRTPQSIDWSNFNPRSREGSDRIFLFA